MALNPYLFIGVGGTGSKTIGVIRGTLLATVKSLGMTTLPLGWQFTHIDVPTDPDTRTEGLPNSLPRSRYVGLAAKTSTFSNMSMGVSSSLESSGRERYLAWDCWRLSPGAVKVNITRGAGQFRGIGRVASQHGLRTIDAAIARALNMIPAIRLPTARCAISSERGASATSLPPAKRVMVIGSVGGGSGSGLLLDVWSSISQGVKSLSATVFTPEVFRVPGGPPGLWGRTQLVLRHQRTRQRYVDHHLSGRVEPEQPIRPCGPFSCPGSWRPGRGVLGGTLQRHRREPNWCTRWWGIRWRMWHSMRSCPTSWAPCYVLANMEAHLAGLSDRLGLSAPANAISACFRRWASVA